MTKSKGNARIRLEKLLCSAKKSVRRIPTVHTKKSSKIKDFLLGKSKRVVTTWEKHFLNKSREAKKVNAILKTSSRIPIDLKDFRKLTKFV